MKKIDLEKALKGQKTKEYKVTLKMKKRILMTIWIETKKVWFFNKISIFKYSVAFWFVSVVWVLSYINLFQSNQNIQISSNPEQVATTDNWESKNEELLTTIDTSFDELIALATQEDELSQYISEIENQSLEF